MFRYINKYWQGLLKGFNKESLLETDSNKNHTIDQWTFSNPFIRNVEEAVEFTIRNVGYQLSFVPGGEAYCNGRTFLEIGPGQDLGVSIILIAHGAKGIIIDKYACKWDNQFHPLYYRSLRNATKDKFLKADLTIFNQLLNQNSHAIQGLTNYELGLEEVDRIPDQTIDWSFSNATFEHLYDVPKAIFQLGRITKSGGLGFHQTDFRDHRDFSRPLEYITMADADFLELVKRVDYSCGNRLRYTDFIPEFKHSGFNVRLSPDVFAEEEYLEDVLKRAQPFFRTIPPDALKVLSGRFHLIKTV